MNDDDFQLPAKKDGPSLAIVEVRQAVREYVHSIARVDTSLGTLKAQLVSRQGSTTGTVRANQRPRPKQQ